MQCHPNTKHKHLYIYISSPVQGEASMALSLETDSQSSFFPHPKIRNLSSSDSELETSEAPELLILKLLFSKDFPIHKLFCLQNFKERKQKLND